MHASPYIILTLASLSLFVGFLAGYGWRGSPLRRKWKAENAALRKAASQIRNPYKIDEE